MFSFLNGSIRQDLAMVFAMQALAVDAQGLEAEAVAQELSRPRMHLPGAVRRRGSWRGACRRPPGAGRTARAGALHRGRH
jgi:hypothetical protein